MIPPLLPAPASSGPISLVLIDDNPLAPTGVVALMRSEPTFRVLAASADVEEALQKVRDTRPDVVLLNLKCVGDDSLMVSGALHGEVPASRVILMGLQPRQADIADFVRAGVSGFIMADASFAVFLRTIRSVVDGVQHLPAQLTGALFEQLKGHGVGGHPKRMLDIKRLTKRERSITDLIVQGLSNKQIAARLQITLPTVKGHVHSLLSKLAVDTRLEVAALSRDTTTTGTAPPSRGARKPRAEAALG